MSASDKIKVPVAPKLALGWAIVAGAATIGALLWAAVQDGKDEPR